MMREALVGLINALNGLAEVDVYDEAIVARARLEQALTLAREALADTNTDALVAAVVMLARYNIPPDIQEVLVQGNPDRGIRPGALLAVLDSIGGSK